MAQEPVSTRGGSLLRSMQAELQTQRLLPGLTCGTLMGVKEIIFALSIGSLVFSGDLAAYLPYGIGMALVTQVIVLIGISLGSSAPGVIGGLQDSPSVILAVIGAALFSTMLLASTEAKFTTFVVAVALTSLLTGAFFLALGFFKLGGLVRFIPYPVVGGFLAGTGWLLLQGSFGVMADYPLTLANLPALLQPDQLILWLPGLALALVLFFAMRRHSHFLVMPGILVGAFILVYVGLLLTGTSLAEAATRGLLLGPVSGEVDWQPLLPQSVLSADWTAILKQSGNIAIILILSVVGLLLNASGIELAIRRDVDLNRELRVAGATNLISGLGGGMVGYHALDLSTLSCRMGARGRLPGVLAGAFCGVMVFAGSPLLAYVPQSILGGMLLFLGIDFLVEWVVDGRSRLPRAEYAAVMLILVTIALTDFLVGVAVGLVATVILFLLSYSRVNVVHFALSGAEMSSNVERCPYHRQQLRELGRQTHILELRGFVFFGTANALLERIRTRVADPEQPPLRFVVLDFRRVTGLDSSAVLGFVKAGQLAEGRKISLVLTHLSEDLQRRFELGGLAQDGHTVRLFSDLDHGLEWCEDQLLESANVTLVDMPLTLKGQLADTGFGEANTDRLMGFLQRLEIGTGEYLIRQGDESTDLYFLECGQMSVQLELEDGRQARLRRLDAGTIVGELGLILEMPRTASVVAEQDTIVYQLSHGDLLRMNESDPELAAALNGLLARMLSERLVVTDQLLEAMLR